MYVLNGYSIQSECIRASVLLNNTTEYCFEKLQKNVTMYVGLEGGGCLDMVGIDACMV